VRESHKKIRPTQVARRQVTCVAGGEDGRADTSTGSITRGQERGWMKRMRLMRLMNVEASWGVHTNVVLGLL
jgi:hypothetical protein